jgi:TonB family protein
MLHLGLIVVLSLSALLYAAPEGNRQESPTSRPDLRQPEGEIVLTELHGAAYPRGAQNAAIQGKVQLELHFKADGTIESLDVVHADHAMLVEAAIKSARASHFDCTNCAGTVPAYSLTYEFRVLASDPEQFCKNPDQQPPPELDASLHKVTVFANEVWTCDPSAVIRRTYTRVRSAKCLYLWKCGLLLESSETLN